MVGMAGPDQTVAPGWQPRTAIKAPMDSLDTDGRFSGYQRIAAITAIIIIFVIFDFIKKL